MSAAFVRRAYGVDFKRGDRVTLCAGTRMERHGVVASFPGQYVGVRFDNDKFTSRCHPTWNLTHEETHDD